ncbi:MAP1B protein, partial [Polypterus senegalus]
MSTPEDLTKDFEELKAQEITENVMTVPSEQSPNIFDEPVVIVHREDIVASKTSPETGPVESPDEGITTTEAEGECEQTPDELEAKENINEDDNNEKFEDEGTGFEETSEMGDYEEKTETEGVEEENKEASVESAFILKGEIADARAADLIDPHKDNQMSFITDKEPAKEYKQTDDDLEEVSEKEETEEDEETECDKKDMKHLKDQESEEDHDSEHTDVKVKDSLPVATPPKLSAPQSPAMEHASIHDETLPLGSESEATASDEENREEPLEEFTATSGYTQSTIEISSEPTPMDEMSTPRDIMSDETTNEESDSPSQDYVKFKMTEFSNGFDRTKLSPLPASSNESSSDYSKTGATEGRDYQHSASTISPPSSMEEDRVCKILESEIHATKDKEEESELGFGTPDKLTLDTKTSPAALSPLAKTPTSERSVNFDLTPTAIAKPIEMGIISTEVTGETVEPSISPDDKTLEVASPHSTPGSAGHTPFHQSPVEEKTSNLPVNADEKITSPTIVAPPSEEEKLLDDRISPMDEPVPDAASPFEKVLSPLRSPPPIGSESSLEGILDIKPHLDSVELPTKSNNEDNKSSTNLNPFLDYSSESSFSPLQEKQKILDVEPCLKEEKTYESAITASKMEEPYHSVKPSSDISPILPESCQFGSFKEESKMSISEGTTSDKSATPVDEVVAEDTFSHIEGVASVSTASLATSSFPEPTADDVSPSLHAEVGSPHSTEVDDSLSVSVVQTPTAFQDTEMSPSKEECPRPMSISPDFSPKTAKSRTPVQEMKSPEQSTMSVEFGQESPDHSLALDFSKQSPEHQALSASALHVTENGPTEVEYSPTDTHELAFSEKSNILQDKTMPFQDTDSPHISASPSEASQSTSSGRTPSQVASPLREEHIVDASEPSHISLFGLGSCTSAESASATLKAEEFSTHQDKSPVTPKAASSTYSPISPDLSPVLGGSAAPEGLPFEPEEVQQKQSKSPINLKTPSPEVECYSTFSIQSSDEPLKKEESPVSPKEASPLYSPLSSHSSFCAEKSINQESSPVKIDDASPKDTKSPVTSKPTSPAYFVGSTESSFALRSPAPPETLSLQTSELSPENIKSPQSHKEQSHEHIYSPDSGDLKEKSSPSDYSSTYLSLQKSKSEVEKQETKVQDTMKSMDKSPDEAQVKQALSPKSRNDVDLCLVNACEYRHPKTELSPSFINPSPLEYFANEDDSQKDERPLTQASGGPPPSGGKPHSRQCDETPPTSVSESLPSQTDSDVPPGTEECPSITADANIDSEDESETLPTDKTLTYRHADPPPIPLRDPAPSPPYPDVCMVDPEAIPSDQAVGKSLKKDTKDKTKIKKQTVKTKSSSPARKSDKPKLSGVNSKTTAVKDSLDKVSKIGSPKKKDNLVTKSSANGDINHVEEKDAKNATNTSTSRGTKSATTGPGSNKTLGSGNGPSGSSFYLDLVYIPNHCNAKNVDAEFFKRVRSSYYVISGNDTTAEEPSKAVLDALLEGKAQWSNNLQVTLIPTHDSDVMREWYRQTHEKQQDLNIMVLASSSTVVMQDESFPACKIEL